MERDCNAFTLVELLVIIAVIAILGALLLPLLAKSKTRAQRISCVNNLHQMGVGSLMYAADYKDILPPWRGYRPYDKQGKMNFMGKSHYSRYVWLDERHTHTLWPITQNLDQPTNCHFENAGFLYVEKYIGNGKIFFCPALKSGEYSDELYQPLLTTDNVKGVVRSSYFYNPRVQDAYNTNYTRRYQKTSDFDGHKLFACDVITPLNPVWTAHLKDRGYCVLFADNSAAFVKSPEAMDAVAEMHSIPDDGGGTIFGAPEDLDNVFNLLER